MILTLYNTSQFQFHINQNKTTFIGPKLATTHLIWLITYLTWLITYRSWLNIYLRWLIIYLIWLIIYLIWLIIYLTCLITHLIWFITYLSSLNIHLISMKQDTHNYDVFATCNMQHESMKGRRYSCLSMMMMMMMMMNLYITGKCATTNQLLSLRVSLTYTHNLIALEQF